MKKVVMGLVLMSFIFGLTACGNGDDEDGKTNYNPQIVNQF